jgi:hypothetical protein
MSLTKNVVSLIETNIIMRAISHTELGLYFVHVGTTHINIGHNITFFYINDDSEDDGYFEEWSPLSVGSIYDIHLSTIYDNKPYKIHDLI